MSASKPQVRPWTSGEEKQLNDMLEAGRTAAEIAVELKRTRVAIYARIQRFYRKRPARDIVRGVGATRRPMKLGLKANK